MSGYFHIEILNLIGFHEKLYGLLDGLTPWHLKLHALSPSSVEGLGCCKAGSGRKPRGRGNLDNLGIAFVAVAVFFVLWAAALKGLSECQEPEATAKLEAEHGNLDVSAAHQWREWMAIGLCSFSPPTVAWYSAVLPWWLSDEGLAVPRCFLSNFHFSG